MKERLHVIADMVTEGHSVADIGTDHGFLPIELVRSGKSPYAIAMDIVEGPLMRAREHVNEAGLNERIECRLSDGFDRLDSGEVDTAVIAGMGGDLICEIISRHPDVVNELILSPHTHPEKVRQSLRDHQYAIIDENMISDGSKYYVVIKAIKGKSDDYEDEPMYDYFGKILIERKDEILLRFLCNEVKKFSNISQKKEYLDFVNKALEAMR